MASVNDGDSAMSEPPSGFGLLFDTLIVRSLMTPSIAATDGQVVLGAAGCPAPSEAVHHGLRR